jgi:hypothetical protein
MSRIIILLLIYLTFTGCTNSTTDNPILEQAIEHRVSALESNYKYQVLSYNGYVGDYKLILQSTQEQLEKKDIEALRDELAKWSSSLGVGLPTLNESTLKQDVNISLILLLDQLILETLKSTTHFSKIDPIVFLEQENDSIAFFYLTLHAKDSLFLPEVLLELSTGTFPIMVDEQTGLTRFTMRKSHKNEKKQFKGSVSYMNDENAIKIGDFEYPRDLIRARD